MDFHYSMSLHCPWTLSWPASVWVVSWNVRLSGLKLQTRLVCHSTGLVTGEYKMLYASSLGFWSTRYSFYWMFPPQNWPREATEVHLWTHRISFQSFSLLWAPVLHHLATPLGPILALGKSHLEKRKKSQLICLEVEVTVIQHCSFYPLVCGSKGLSWVRRLWISLEVQYVSNLEKWMFLPHVPLAVLKQVCGLLGDELSLAAPWRQKGARCPQSVHF